jgi:hypothetical protein
MRFKRIVIPIGAALAALIPNVPEAAKLPADSLEAQETPKTGAESVNPVLQQLMFQIGQNAHTLTLHKSSSGKLYAQHGSHSSHSSHSSHRSGN